MQKGDVYLAILDPVVGSEQAGTRPVVVVQNSQLSQFTRTVVIIPFTTNVKRAELPSAVLLPKGEGGLAEASVALCHQVRVLDKMRLIRHIGKLPEGSLSKINETLAFVLDI